MTWLDTLLASVEATMPAPVPEYPRPEQRRLQKVAAKQRAARRTIPRDHRWRCPGGHAHFRAEVSEAHEVERDGERLCCIAAL